MIRFHFYYKKTYWLARVIRWATKGDWNHVSIEVDGVFWEAIGMRINCVVCSHSPVAYHQGKHKPTKTKAIDLPVNDAIKSLVVRYLKLMEGVKYDKTGAMAFVAPFFNENPQRKFCSEIGSDVFKMVTDLKLGDDQVSPTELHDQLLIYLSNKREKK